MKVSKTGKIRVQIRMDRMGNLIGKPVRKDIQDIIAKYMLEMTGHYDSSFFIQGAEAIGDLGLSPQMFKELEKGWDIYPLMDPWEMGHWYGWDAHTLFE